MLQLPKHYLYLSSIILLLFFASCKISKYKNAGCDRVFLTEKLLQPIIKPNQLLKYKATIDVLKNHLSGILIVKQTDSITTHFVFVTELGMKMFDFSYSNHTMKADFVFEPLNKPKLVASLMRNFENMFLLNVINREVCRFDSEHKEQYFFFTDGKVKIYYTECVTDDNTIDLKLQEVFYKKKRSIKVNYVYKPTITDTLKTNKGSNYIYNNYSQISLKQYGIVKIYIDLNYIEQ